MRLSRATGRVRPVGRSLGRDSLRRCRRVVGREIADHTIVLMVADAVLCGMHEHRALPGDQPDRGNANAER